MNCPIKLPPLPELPDQDLVGVRHNIDGDECPIFEWDEERLKAWATAYAEQAVRGALAAQEPVAWIAMANGIPVDRPSRDRWLIERSAGSWTGGHVSALAIIPENNHE
ncbi:hypothetical protein ACOTJF_18095 [Achromobacter ruhlandii]|uniref:hypothetical protein n=1 Tax=Achromobacter ruhlandii TaxID=72557 RepID=UPI003BA181D1